MDVKRPRLSEIELSAGVRTRLHRILYEFGPKNGTLLILPIDQGLEHGPEDFFSNPDSSSMDYIFKLAIEGNFSAVACHIGLAEQYYPKYAGRMPLVLKLNGKTNIPSDANAFSPLTGTVEDAVRLGADAVGYTLFVGSPKQDADIAQLNKVRQDCRRFGMPLIVWSYPRGSAIDEKGGKDSLYAVDYAARVAEELGANIVKINMPKPPNEKCPKPYPSIQEDDLARMKRVVKSAGKSLVLVSGGSKLGDEDLLHKVETAMQAGATGIIFGRNMWQREKKDALEITKKVHAILKKYGD
ncbi:Fructose-bisphosphate aldolase class 1 [uncultured archaeon]|nr:Fructose-bisphosphate aldolase class 1 [uncultured archaeon]